MKKYVAPAAVILAGLVFIVLTFSQNLFSVGSDFEEMITDFRPALDDEVIATYMADIDTLETVPVEFATQVLPALAQATATPADELAGNLALGYPAVFEGVTMLPDAVPGFRALIQMLDDQQENFASADAIPTSSFVAQTVPWGFLVMGLLALGLGVWMLLKGTRLTSIIAVVLGALIVIGSFTLSLPGKSSDTDDLNDALNPIFTPATIDDATTKLGTIAAMGEEMGTAMIPGLSAMLGQSPEEVGQFLASVAPATAGALQTFPETLGRFDHLITTFGNNLDNYETLKPVKFVPIIWTFIFGGFLIIIGGALGFIWKKDEE